MKPTLALHKLPLYNTGRLDDQDIIAAFSARQPVFERIIADLSAENGDSRAQHHLLVGQRGMGKTMLLARIAAEIRTGPLGQRLIPLVFAEEQYAVDRLSKFWLNCLDSLADARDRAGDKAGAEKIDVTVEQLSAKLPGAAKDDAPLARDALEAFLEAAASLHRRPVLLVDNLQLVFERISEEQQHALREVLMRPGCPVLVGASPVPPPESQDYGAAFYDHFKVHYLRPLEVEEMKALMLHLAEISQRPEVRERILQHPQRLPVLRQLTGGNPRTTATLFFLYAEDFAPSVFGDLENLLDRVTPLYKARFEELAKQQQVIASAIANHWDPVTSRTLAEMTGLPMTGISPQLDRLEKTGFIERVGLFEQSSTGYQIAERFFNVWFLMRSASRRQRREVEFLTRFIENFYEAQDRSRLAEQLLGERDLSPDRHLFARALARTLDNEATAEDLERHTQLDALRQKAENTRARLDEVLDLSALPTATLEFNGLREKLMALVPSGSPVNPEDFAQDILRDRKMFFEQDRERLASKIGPLTEKEISLLRATVAERRNLDSLSYGRESSEWLEKRLSMGLLRNPADLDDWRRSIRQCPSSKVLSYILDCYLLCGHVILDTHDLEELLTDEPNYEHKAVNAENLLADALRRTKAHFDTIQEFRQAFRQFTTTEKSALRAWIGLGIVLTWSNQKYEEAAEAFKGACQAAPNFAYPWNFLGDIYNNHLNQFKAAEAAYLKAVEIEPHSTETLAKLAKLYRDKLARPHDATDAFTRILAIEPDSESTLHDLLSVQRDSLQKLSDAEPLIDRLKALPKLDSPDLLPLQESLFAAYDQNWGHSRDHLSQALQSIPDGFPANSRDGWLRASAVFIHLHYGKELLALLEDRGDHLRLRPWYEALRALHLGDRGHLQNIAPEVRTTAEAFFDQIEHHLNALPAATRRRPLPKAKATKKRKGK